MSNKIVFKYIPEKNPTNAFILGVPLDDLTEKKFETLPDRKKQSVLNQPFYEPVVDEETAVVLEGWNDEEE